MPTGLPTDRAPEAVTARRRLSAVARLGSALLAVALVAPACSSGSAGGGTTPTAGPSAGCVARPGDQLVLLADDRHSQNSDNVVPVARSSDARPPLTEALEQVSRALSQDELQGLNRAVAVDGTDVTTAATDFVRRRGLGAGLSGGRGPIVVGAVDFRESAVLSVVYATVLRQAGYDARVQRLSTREALVPALESGRVQVTPEYAATLTEFLAGRMRRPGVRASNAIGATLAVLRPLASANGLTVLDPAAATNQNAFAVTKTTADTLGVTTLSRLAALCGSGISFGGPPECPQRPFCQPALEHVYGLRITRFVPLDAAGPRTRDALRSGQVLLGEVFTSDADVVTAGS
jgi:osmoprotectant transport system substrate-binding protein